MAPARTKTSFHGKIVESHAMTIGEAVGRGALAFFEPDGHGDDLPGEDRGLGQPQQPAEKCELFHIGRKAASDAGRRPCQDAQKHHLFRAEPVDQDARYGIHDGVAYQEDVDDEGIAVVVHVEGRFDRRLEDRKQLAVEVIADDGDEDRHHDHPFPFFRVVQQVHACRRCMGLRVG